MDYYTTILPIAGVFVTLLLMVRNRGATIEKLNARVERYRERWLDDKDAVFDLEDEVKNLREVLGRLRRYEMEDMNSTMMRKLNVQPHPGYKKTEPVVKPSPLPKTAWERLKDDSLEGE